MLRLPVELLHLGHKKMKCEEEEFGQEVSPYLTVAVDVLQDGRIC